MPALSLQRSCAMMTRMMMIIRFTAIISLLMFQVVQASRKSASETPRGSLNSGQCRFVFNELNIFPAGTKQFMELKRACSIKPDRLQTASVSNYLLLFITHDAYLIGSCKLGEGGKDTAKTRDGNVLFYVIGGEEAGNVDMLVKHCKFAEDHPNSNPNRFPTGDSAPIAVALVYNKDYKVISGLELEKTNEVEGPKRIFIRYSMELLIMKHLQDMVIISSSSPYTGCKYFETFFSGYTLSSKSVLRDWGQYEDVVQRSLSRCDNKAADPATDWQPFQSQKFSLAKVSPGKNNECLRTIPFRYEDYQPARKVPRLDFSSRYSCQITTEDEAIDQLHMITSPLTYQEKLRSLIVEAEIKEPAAEPMDFDAQEIEVSDSEVITSAQPKESSPDYFTTTNGSPPKSVCTPDPQPLSTSDFEAEMASAAPFLWQNCDNFEPQNLVSAIRAQGKNSPIKESDILAPDTCNWLDWLPETKNFRCKFCHRLWNQKILFDSRTHITKIITTGQGYVTGSNAKYDNKRLIESHKASPLHSIAVEYHSLFDKGLRGDLLRKKFPDPDGPYRRFLKSTENRFVSVFQATKLDLPFFRYNLLTELLKHFNVDLGGRFDNPTGNKEILMSISEKLHITTADYLKETKPEMSILIDTSSDISSRYTMAVLFQTYDTSGDIGVIVYRVLHVDRRETTENLYQILIEALKEDGLLEWVKEKAIGFSTDGGSNVKALKDLLNQITHHNLIYNYCHNHRLERAVKKAWGSDDLLSEIDAIINELHRTFNSKSPRKKLLMIQKLRENSDSNFELQQVKKIRWSNSKRRAARTVARHWKTIVNAIESVKTDKTFPTKQREAAANLEAKMKDPVMIALLAFVADATGVLATVSLDLQSQATTLIGKKRKRDDMKTNLILMKTKPGQELTRILEAARIPSKQSTGLTVAEFGDNQIELFGTTLNPSTKLQKGRLQGQIDAYIDSLVVQIDSYFPTDASDKLDILHPALWKMGSLDSYGNEDLLGMNSQWNWNFPSEELLEDWRKLKSAVVNHPSFSTMKFETVEKFWSYYLKQEVAWAGPMKIIIRNMLTVPAGTAHVERIYSYYTATKTSRRYNLDVSSVEAIIRVKLNGPSTVREFADSAHDYVKHFILTGHSRSDDSVQTMDKSCDEHDENQGNAAVSSAGGGNTGSTESEEFDEYSAEIGDDSEEAESSDEYEETA